MAKIQIIMLHVELEKPLENLEEFVAQRTQSLDAVKNVEVVKLFPAHFEVHPAGKPSFSSNKFHELLNKSFVS